MKFSIIFLLVIRLGIAIALYFFLGRDRPSKEDCSNGIWQSHMIPELLFVYKSGRNKLQEMPPNPDQDPTSVSRNRTSTDGKIDEGYRQPSYLNYEYKVMNGGVIMEEKPAGFTFIRPD
ncbi:hypothetical protein FPOAC1_001307 [Fusarium poae]|uniref:hypothetical protein n=1 Tax=Fusarium poae TaxID=36050 RepID=UPI001CEBD501|nr:hypothetical protein FPOAC1_001307 [Fusarium poae]KAG8675329.1 hypothetical protein FPOAC1_001307 [Fusarium poae]